MADPKYAGLPGIAFDQPDFYESESSDNIVNQDSISHDQSDSIEKLSTNIKDSYMKFEGHWLDSSRADFSGKISAKHHTGFRSWSGPYEIQAEGEKENPLQKLNRLKCEVAELEEELAKNNIPESEVPATETLAFQVQALQKQLMAIKIQETVGSTAPQLLGQSQNKKLAELQEAMKNSANAPKASADASKGENGSVVYELQYKPHQVQLESACKKSDLMSRLDKLCQTLVGNHEKLERLNAETGQKSLVDIVQSMHAKLSAWDVSQIDQVDARLGVLLHKLNVISEKHLVVEDQEKLSKVKAAYEMVKKLEPLMVVLPSVVERLLALKQLHEDAASFSQSLAHIGNIQGQLEASMKSQAQLLSDIQTGLVANMGSMNEAVKHIEARQAPEKKK